MRANWVLVAGALVAGCQTYDFERVVPFTITQKRDTKKVTARRLKPNVMLLVDNSLSMIKPINAANPNCAAGCGDRSTNQCAPSCPTRVSELKQAMAAFLPQAATTFRLGVTVFPTSSSGCSPATNIDVQLPAPTETDDNTDAALTSAANLVGGRIQTLIPSGGTPTGSSLEFLGTYSGLTDANDGREDFVLVLTDGLPNCNAENVNNICSAPTNSSACACTQEAGCAGSLCAIGCLDRDNTVEKVKALKQKGIKTIVVGFGADLASGDGPTVLNAMAEAGDFPRSCPMATDAECGGAVGSCNTFTKRCATSFFQVSTGAELAAALEAIAGSIDQKACRYTLSESPSNPQYLAVILNGESLLPGPETYRYETETNTVEFLGATCRRLEATTEQNPLELEFRIVQAL